MNPSEGAREKLFWLEFLAAWCGRATMKKLGSLLGMTREAAQRALSPRIDEENIAIRRQPRNGIKFEGDVGQIKFGPSSPRQYMTTLSWDRCLSECLRTEPRIPVPFEDISWLASELAANTDEHHENFRQLAIAVSMGHAVALTYRSKRKLLTFEFSPHALVRTAFRAHFRGFARYDDGRGAYMDLVPDRIINIGGTAHSLYVGSKGDADWNAEVTLKLEPPDVSQSVLEALLQEYGAFPVVVTTRKATERYVTEAFRARILSFQARMDRPVREREIFCETDLPLS